jgi:hypothetical protein
MRFIVSITILVAFAAPAAAQRALVSVNGGYQLTSNAFTSSMPFVKNVEAGRFDTNYSVKGGPSFDVAGSARIWRQLAVVAGVSRFTHTTPGALQAQVPHPFFFDRPRTVSGTVDTLKREELILQAGAGGMFAIGPRLAVTVFGGPAFFQVKQDTVTAFTYTETYPYDTASFRSATTSSASQSKIGFGGGADVAFFFTRHVGVGGVVQFASATLNLSAADSVKVGGLQTGGGLRIRF